MRSGCLNRGDRRSSPPLATTPDRPSWPCLPRLLTLPGSARAPGDVGAEVAEALINGASLAHNLTNEGGACGTFRFSRNVTGLWLVQECRRTWAQEGSDYTYTTLTEMASQARPFQAVIDPDLGEFLKPGDMPARIRRYCQATGQPVPQDKGAVTLRAEGIASSTAGCWNGWRCRLALEPLHIVGGGTCRTGCCRSSPPCHRAQACGPSEATAAATSSCDDGIEPG